MGIILRRPPTAEALTVCTLTWYTLQRTALVLSRFQIFISQILIFLSLSFTFSDNCHNTSIVKLSAVFFLTVQNFKGHIQQQPLMTFSLFIEPLGKDNWYFMYRSTNSVLAISRAYQLVLPDRKDAQISENSQILYQILCVNIVGHVCVICVSAYVLTRPYATSAHWVDTNGQTSVIWTTTALTQGLLWRRMPFASGFSESCFTITSKNGSTRVSGIELGMQSAFIPKIICQRAYYCNSKPIDGINVMTIDWPIHQTSFWPRRR